MKTASTVFRILRQTAPRLGQDAFVCRRCLQSQASSPQAAYKSLRQTPFLQAFRSHRPQSVSKAIRHSSSAGAAPSHASSPVGNLGKTIGTSGAKAAPKKSFFPETSSKPVAYWLLGSAASVFGLVIFGGLTRLTESGSVLPSFSRRPISMTSSLTFL